MRDDEPISEHEQRALLLLTAAFLIFWMGVELGAAAEAWAIAEVSDARWSYARYTAHLPLNCGWVLEQIVCVSAELAGR